LEDAGKMDGSAREGSAPAPAAFDGETHWQIEVKQGPNQGATVPLEAGEFRIGTELSNDIVLADADVAAEQATLSVDGTVAVLHTLAPGVVVAGKEVAPGEDVEVKPGTVIHAGGTILQVSGPRVRRPWWVWAMVGVPAVFLLTGGAALVGLTSPREARVAPPPLPAVSPVSAVSASDAVAALEAQLKDAGLGDRIKLTAGAGAVIAEGALPGPDLVRWKEQQVWFDSHYKGALSLVNRVGEAKQEEGPPIKIAAVIIGDPSYVVTASGDRYTEGAVLKDNWSIEHIAADKVTFLHNGGRVEVGL
jgi:hypothetical protein